MRLDGEAAEWRARSGGRVVAGEAGVRAGDALIGDGAGAGMRVRVLDARYGAFAVEVALV